MTDPVSLVRLRQAIAKVQRRDPAVLLADLEQQEPVLTEHLLNELAGLHHDLSHDGIPPLRLERSTQRLRRLCLVLIQALRLPPS